ncbi:hypothetical protein SAMN05443668_10466 [Cryptosporangium aurantiacum]|uniref:Uncharacterized protein n=1 Tax=Cryptosporangium aurantiacum TaxID=134849 RepID=A0A1M7Q2T8_9ACTN|nr:hypothetical protein SAMN05443668_10466 [Cryptosporangium aurantiacum]
MAYHVEGSAKGSLVIDQPTHEPGLELADWYPNYSQGGSPERPEVGYDALPWKPQHPSQRPAFGPDAEALIGAIRAHEQELPRGGAPCRCR